jgi:transketolase
MTADKVSALQNIANRFRIESIRATTEAGSGHPSTCASAAELAAALFFGGIFRMDPKNPKHPLNDHFVLSKGHAAPLLYAILAEAGVFPREELMKLRRIDSDLEGHPTPKVPFVDVATGSLGQGLSAAVGLAFAGKLDQLDYRVYVLQGDGETTEGAVWEAAQIASFYKLDNLTLIVDVNRLGQSQPTMLQHDMETYKKRFTAFGWRAIVVDGHNIEEILSALRKAVRTKEMPTAILAKTFKGHGISLAEDKEGWHGRPLKKDEAAQAIAELEQKLTGADSLRVKKPPKFPPFNPQIGAVEPPAYNIGDAVATREAYGTALVKVGKANPNVVALDGDTKNSTFSERFLKEFPDRFFEDFIAEQNMVGAAAGLSARGKIPFVSTFACFQARAADFIRMAVISRANIKFCGSHAGVSIGEDGPSQMGLEDLALFRANPDGVVLYPSDAVATERAVALAAQHDGIVFIRTSRPKTPVIYENSETFAIGQAKILRQSPDDVVTVVGAGVTLFEALKAHEQLKAENILIRVVDLFSVKPVDRDTLLKCARETKNQIITVEDHYAEGGLGDAVLSALATDGVIVHKLAVRELPRSGKPEELLDRYGISARQIVEKARSLK